MFAQWLVIQSLVLLDILFIFTKTVGMLRFDYVSYD